MNEKFKYAHAARVTPYKGIDFDSLLEAKYAFVFDGLNKSWLYHPFDGIFWNPDFRLSTDAEASSADEGLLVEVKPYVKHDLWREMGVIEKIKKTGIREEWVYLLGEHPLNEASLLVYFDSHGNISDQELLKHTADIDADILQEIWYAASNNFTYRGKK